MIDIRYAQIRECDISNGEGIGVALFVQGCYFHCKNCFNPETWDFSGGREWTREVKDKFITLANRPYIKRISILGGEPLAEENSEDVLDLVNEIHAIYPQKSIWIYTGFTWEQLFNDALERMMGGLPTESALMKKCKETIKKISIQRKIVSMCNILIGGRYMDSQRDTLAYRGSKNQRVIDVQKSLDKGEIALWKD